MPTYEYACPKCGIVEAFQSIKDDALTRCPTCKKAKVTRLLSCGSGVIFKGSGFWETDYNRSSDYRKRSSDESSSASKSGGPDPKSVPATKLQKNDGGAAPSSSAT